MYDSLALEYYRNSGEAEASLKFPFSIFLTQAGRRMVVAVDRLGDGYRVKHWDLHSCGPLQRLPPMKEYIMTPGTPVFNAATVLPGASMFQYQMPERFCRRSQSRMDEHELHGHSRDVANYLNCDTHRVRKAWWLMEAFHAVYGKHLRFSIPPSEESSAGADSVVAMSPRACSTWKAWRKHLLDLPSEGQAVAPEVLFRKVYTKPAALNFKLEKPETTRSRMNAWARRQRNSWLNWIAGNTVQPLEG